MMRGDRFYRVRSVFESAIVFMGMSAIFESAIVFMGMSAIFESAIVFVDGERRSFFVMMRGRSFFVSWRMRSFIGGKGRAFFESAIVCWWD
jgi:hypothetical protein